MIKLIVCCDLDGNIGKNNDLLFHIPQDMKFFKQMTENNVVVMGMNTWNSLPIKPLPNRTNIILSRKSQEVKGTIYNTIEKVIEDYNYCELNKDLYVIGGANIYNQFIDMDIVDEAYVTLVFTKVENADTRININKLEDQLPKCKNIIKDFTWENKRVMIYKLSK